MSSNEGGVFRDCLAVLQHGISIGSAGRLHARVRRIIDWCLT
jgi:hypothetical protein